MDDTNDSEIDGFSDRLHDGLRSVGETIDVGTSATAQTRVRRLARRRRARGRMAKGAVAALGLAAGGVVIASAVRDDDAGTSTETPITTASSSPSPTGAPTTIEPEGEAALEASSTAPTSDPASTVPSTPAPAGASNASRTLNVVAGVGVPVGAGSLPSDGGLQWLVPWRDGFLATTGGYVPQPLPDELPDDIISRFPQEVIDLFDGELPDTIDEAIAMLNEAGLYDEVNEIVVNDPEVSAAIYGETVPQIDPKVYFSTDGADWEQVDFVLPPSIDSVHQVASTGDRLVAMGEGQPTNTTTQPAPARPQGPLMVASTTNLTDWEIVELETPAPPVDIPDTFSHYAWPQSLSVDADRWVVSTSSSIEVDVDRLVRERGLTSDGGMSVSATDDGYAIAVHDGRPGDATPSEQFVVTWDELGASAELVELMTSGVGEESVVHSAAWEGEVARSLIGHTSSVVAIADGLYATGFEGLSYSADGVSWHPVETPGGWIESVFAAGGEAIATMVADDGTTGLYVVDGPDSSMTRLEADALPEHVQFSYGRSVADAFIVNASDLSAGFDSTIVVERDGLQLTLSSSGRTTTYRLIDVASGEVLLDESPSLADGSQPEWLEYGAFGGITLSDPETGEVLVEFTDEEITAAYEQANPPEAFQEPDFDEWLLASADGHTWLAEDLADTDTNMANPSGARLAALNGTTVLLYDRGEWVRYELG